jgi:Tfp pilus assembly protein PilX
MTEFVIHHLIRRGGAQLRRGSVYLIVLATSMMVTVIGLSALFAVRVQRRNAEITQDRAEALLCAQSAVELGLLKIQNPNWRDSEPNGIWLSN